MSQFNENAPRRRQLTPEQRQKILRMRKKQRMKKRLMLIVPIAVVLIAVLVVVLVTTGGGKPADAKATATPAVEVTPTPTPEPTMNPALSPVSDFVYDEAYVAALKGETTGPVLTADYSKVDPAKMDRWPSTAAGKMPLLYQANTDENIIAVTVDDCYQGPNLMQIVQCAVQNNAKLTIFPIGDNLTKDSVANAIRYAFENGMELENHTYNHAGMYHYDDVRMTSEMWYQSTKLNEVLGVNYQQHFFRPKGGDEREDQRVQAYAKQMGMSALAIWSQSGSKDSLESLYANLAPGRIYLFHTTDHDVSQLLDFIPGAIARGYRLVTLNEMFGLPENEVTTYDNSIQMPALQPFDVDIPTLEKTDYIRAAAVVQKRLIELGWLTGEADGVYGNSSYNAIGFFQLAAGIQANGVADEATQIALFADDAPKGSPERIEELKSQLKK